MSATLGWAILATALSGQPAEAHAVDEDLGGPPSAYAQVLVEELARADPVAQAIDPSVPLHLTCVATPGNDRYVGVVQDALIRAPLEAVQAVQDDVAHHRDLFPGCEQVEVVPGSRDGNRLVTSWVMAAPVFFLPRSRFELTVLVSRPSPTRVVTRYRLLRGDTLVHSDGMVILDAVDERTTRFREYDFFDARWGPLPAELVWRASLRDVYVSAVAVKLRAENPTWTYELVTAEARRLLALEGERLERCRLERRAARPP